MPIIKLPRLIYISLSIFLVFILCFTIAILFEPNTLQKYFSAISMQAVETKLNANSAGYYFDVSAYANMSLSDQCTAFYPMLPWIVRNLFRPTNFEQAVIGLKIISCICFVISIPLSAHLINKIVSNQNTAFLLSLVYNISPMAIFRVIGYTEGLFALLSLVLIWLLITKNLDLKITSVLTFAIVFCMSLTRPVSLQIIFSTITTLIIISLTKKAKENLQWHELFKSIKDQYKNWVYQCLMMTAATVSGYSIYGFLCLQLRSDFLAPFNDQRLWGKSLGFYPQIFWSLEYPLFEQMSLYFPVIFLIGIIVTLYIFLKPVKLKVFIPTSSLGWWLVLLYPSIFVLVYILVSIFQKMKKVKLTTIELYNSQKTKKLLSNHIFWFCFCFVMSHIFINLLTVDKIYSLSRFTFSLPFFFVFVAYILVQDKKLQK